MNGAGENETAVSSVHGTAIGAAGDEAPAASHRDSEPVQTAIDLGAKAVPDYVRVLVDELGRLPASKRLRAALAVVEMLRLVPSGRSPVATSEQEAATYPGLAECGLQVMPDELLPLSETQQQCVLNRLFCVRQLCAVEASHVHSSRGQSMAAAMRIIKSAYPHLRMGKSTLYKYEKRYRLFGLAGLPDMRCRRVAQAAREEAGETT